LPPAPSDEAASPLVVMFSSAFFFFHFRFLFAFMIFFLRAISLIFAAFSSAFCHFQIFLHSPSYFQPIDFSSDCFRTPKLIICHYFHYFRH